MKDLKVRVISSLFLLAYLWFFLWLDSLLFTCVALAPIVIATFYEVNDSISLDRVGVMSFINAYLVVGFSAILFVKQLYGAKVLFVLVLIAVAADSFAYAFGRFFRGPKLCPSISPSKTISGFLGGVSMAWIIGYFAYMDLVPQGFFKHDLIAITIFVAAAVIGDLAESMMKRSLDLKDFGCVVPGHGGMFDRLDSTLLVATACLVAHGFGL